MAAVVLLLEQVPVVFPELFHDVVVELRQAKKNSIAQGCVDTLVHQFYLVLHRGLVFWPAYPCGQQCYVVVQAPLYDRIGKNGFVAAAFTNGSFHVVAFERLWRTTKKLQAQVKCLYHIWLGGIGQRHGKTIATAGQYCYKYRALYYLATVPVNVGQAVAGKVLELLLLSGQKSTEIWP